MSVASAVSRASSWLSFQYSAPLPATLNTMKASATAAATRHGRIRAGQSERGE